MEIDLNVFLSLEESERRFYRRTAKEIAKAQGEPHSFKIVRAPQNYILSSSRRSSKGGCKQETEVEVTADGEEELAKKN